MSTTYLCVFLSLISAGMALILTPVIRDFFRRRGWVDRPDARRIHPIAVPRTGGISVFIAYAAALAFLLTIPSNVSSGIRHEVQASPGWLSAVLVMFLIGLLDDLFNLGASLKLLGELAASALAIWAGVRIHGVAGVELPSWLAVPLTTMWLVGCSNAFNLIDGVDGLAVGAGLFATITTLIAGLLQRNLPLVLVTIPLAGALLGFLRYNFNPASIFLGDCGSLLVGFLLGCFGIEWSQKSATVVGMTAPLLAFAIPLLDTLVSMGRRFIRRRPIFEADREHIHHKLLQRGLSPRRVVLLMYGACGVSAVLSLLLGAQHDRYAGFVVIAFCVAAWIGIQHLGYTEFQLVRRLVFAGTYRRLINSHLALQGLERALTSASDIGQVWALIRQSYRTFGFHEVELRVDNELYSERTVDGGIRAWTARIPLSRTDWLMLTRRTDSEIPPIMAAYIDTLSSALRKKLPELSTSDRISEYAPVAPASSH